MKQRPWRSNVYHTYIQWRLNFYFTWTHQHMHPFSRKPSSSPEVYLHPPLQKLGGAMVNKTSTTKEITHMRSYWTFYSIPVALCVCMRVVCVCVLIDSFIHTYIQWRLKIYLVSSTTVCLQLFYAHVLLSVTLNTIALKIIKNHKIVLETINKQSHV